MKRWMDRMKWEGCYNWSSKINKLENLNILLTLTMEIKPSRCLIAKENFISVFIPKLMMPIQS